MFRANADCHAGSHMISCSAAGAVSMISRNPASGSARIASRPAEEAPVNSPALQTYLAGIDPAAEPLVTALDEAIRTAHPEFDVAVKYKILMYALRGD